VVPKTGTGRSHRVLRRGSALTLSCTEGFQVGVQPAVNDATDEVEFSRGERPVRAGMPGL